MAGLDPAIFLLTAAIGPRVVVYAIRQSAAQRLEKDGRVKPGHDGDTGNFPLLLLLLILAVAERRS